MRIQTKNLSLDLLENNKGQIKGVPKNPRMIRDKRFAALRASIEGFPDMLELRELVV